MTLPRVILSQGRARPFYGRHPWVFAGAIAGVEGDPVDGATVDLVANSGEFIARGIFNSQSKIRVRLYSWRADVELDEQFFRARLERALNLRRDFLGLDGADTACRLVFSEGDGLSGLTVDRYDRWLAVQFTALGMAQRREMWSTLLQELCQPEGIYVRTEKGVGSLEGLALEDAPLWGQAPPPRVLIREHGLSFQVNLSQGQKTGYYLDQRENRLAVAQLAAGRRVLDAFCYSGGFGLHALAAGATQVVGIDASESALELARENARLNGFQDRTNYLKADVFAQMRELVDAGEQFGMVVLDPPKFARARHAVREALGGYRRLQTLALRMLPENGILVTCCCSGLIDEEMLVDLLSQLVQAEKRDIQILERRGQAPDHPVAASCLESRYLKCLICRVM